MMRTFLLSIMRRALLAVVFWLLCAAPSLAQTNPCAVPLDESQLTLVTDPSMSVVSRIPDYNGVFNGQPLVTDVELKVVPRGAGANANAIANGTITNPKSAWVLVPGASDCYQVGTVGQFLFAVPANTEFELWARSRWSGGAGPWSTNAVPFGRPAGPAAQTGLRITR